MVLPPPKTRFLYPHPTQLALHLYYYSSPRLSKYELYKTPLVSCGDNEYFMRQGNKKSLRILHKLNIKIFI